jgi:quinol-cytochrome oxidoreductase complex cytochrome b subunit
MEEDVQPTLGNTRRIAFAIWWKLCAVLWIGPFLAGFLGYLIPWGQLRFWLAIQIANVFGDAIGQYLFRSPHAMQVGVVVRFNIFTLAIVFVLLNALLARHVGRTFGGFRLVLQRVQQ